MPLECVDGRAGPRRVLRAPDRDPHAIGPTRRRRTGHTGHRGRPGRHTRTGAQTHSSHRARARSPTWSPEVPAASLALNQTPHVGRFVYMRAGRRSSNTAHPDERATPRSTINVRRNPSTCSRGTRPRHRWFRARHSRLDKRIRGNDSTALSGRLAEPSRCSAGIRRPVRRRDARWRLNDPGRCARPHTEVDEGDPDAVGPIGSWKPIGSHRPSGERG
jgi:hypothetical protein